MGYGPNLLNYFRSVAIMAAKILRGANPAETPEFFSPAGYDAIEAASCRTCFGGRVIARMKPSVTVAQARAALGDRRGSALHQAAPRRCARIPGAGALAGCARATTGGVEPDHPAQRGWHPAWHVVPADTVAPCAGALYPSGAPEARALKRRVE